MIISQIISKIKLLNKIFNLRKRKSKPIKKINYEDDRYKINKYERREISKNFLNSKRNSKNKFNFMEVTNYKDEEDSIFEDADESCDVITKFKQKITTKCPKSFEIDSEIYKLSVNGFTTKNYNKEMIPVQKIEKQKSIPENNISKIEKSYNTKEVNVLSNKGSTSLPLLTIHIQAI